MNSFTSSSARSQASSTIDSTISQDRTGGREADEARLFALLGRQHKSNLELEEDAHRYLELASEVARRDLDLRRQDALQDTQLNRSRALREEKEERQKLLRNAKQLSTPHFSLLNFSTSCCCC